MNTQTSASQTYGSEVAEAGPVRPGSDRLRELYEAIGERAFERELVDLPPDDAYALVRESGFGAFRVPRQLGGGGASMLEFFDALIELAVIDPNVAHALRSHFIFVDARLAAFARGLEGKWLEQVLAGALFGNATTELGNRNTGGLDAGRFQTKLIPAPDGFRLNGTKFYTTGSLYSDWVSVAAATPGGEVVTATVPVGRPGVQVEDDWDGIGQRLTASGTTRFQDVFVAPDEVTTRQEGGHAAGHTTAMAQLHLTAVVAGIIEAATRDAVKVLRGRTRTFTHGAGATATEDPLLQQVVGQLASNAFAARAAVLEAARTLDAAAASAIAGEETADELIEEAKLDCAKAKVLADGLAERSGWLVFDVAGATATRRSLNLDRHWRNARTLASHNPGIYKARALGDHLVNGGPLPASALF